MFDLQSEDEGVMKVALTAMMSSSELYRKYSEAFTHKKLSTGKHFSWPHSCTDILAS